MRARAETASKWGSLTGFVVAGLTADEDGWAGALKTLTKSIRRNNAKVSSE